ncbi:VCBS repeat-containing protein [Fulvivirga lutimaris]|uniref:VCBS repeat-containing protein n=1 Tax=Fulvivirga lutimaris TaxID=1819566 RepID=UPI0012BC7061|nr:VCBS repeat-containing protein [Fulvivirga lutimaris]MTI39603.1 VCBS repeat-containing protein [Fulvivirga lutimaris]
MKYLRLVFLFLIVGCAEEAEETKFLFSDVTGQSNIDFSNDLTFTEELNPYTYRNFYNGGGVAIGDINNDGLSDIYFAGNQVDNKLYLNEGSFKFKDITTSAGVACPEVWSTGVTFVDINADGYLDIYVCKSGDPNTPNRSNELFINNGDLTFTERSKEYGLDIKGLSVHAAFFDYDKDGDLDCYILTNSIKSVGNYDLIENQRDISDQQGGGNKFLINNNGHFEDYTTEAGIYNSSIGFGLGITLGDFNHDDWVDVFISNDFFERDYLYINDKKGGFKESLTDYFESISMGSMGADVADLDNDGRPELFVTEMLPDSLSRRKTKAIYENWDKYQLNVNNGYHNQFPRNILQKSITDSTYVELGRLSDIAATEWSWGALLFDMNNDGLRDIFIANGIYKDLLDRDYLTYQATNERIKEMIKSKEDVITNLVETMPSSAVANYAFMNEGNFKFKNVGDGWGFSEPTFSNGSAYGDLDNDGDLDLVLNNINSLSKIYRNNTDSGQYKNISILLKGNDNNSLAVGTKLKIYANGRTYFADNFVTRGFQSSVDNKVVVGLGQGIDNIDSLIIVWPDGEITKRKNIGVNQSIEISRGEDEAKYLVSTSNSKGVLLEKNQKAPTFKHSPNGMVDFNRNRLLPMMYSNETPKLLVGDVDNNGLNDVIIGGGKDQYGALFISYKEGFKTVEIENNPKGETTEGVLFDADGDGDLDLYHASGGRFYPSSSSVLMDKILLNDGKGNYSESPRALPFKSFVSTSTVVAFDYDNDGDNDLFIGERFDPFYYGVGGSAFLFANDGKGSFTDVTDSYAPMLKDIGMVTSAETADINTDGKMDLVIVGDWMPITFLTNTGSGFERNDFTANTEGWWNSIETADLNGDSKPDFVVGNHGLNSFFKPSDRMYVNDFDGNGSIEQIFCTQVNGKYYPILDKDELISQLPLLKKKLIYYENYASMGIEDLFDTKTLSETKIFEVKKLESILLLSTDNGYESINLPQQAQFAPVYALLIDDFDGDGILDLIAGGNQYNVKPQFGRFDASKGWYFKGENTDGFRFQDGVPLNIAGQIRDIKKIDLGEVKYLVISKYGEAVEYYEIHF